jgi:hypothetical protein
MGEPHFPSGHFPDGHFPDGHFPDGASVLPTNLPRGVFRLRLGSMRRVFRLRVDAMSSDEQLRFDDVIKNPTEVYPVKLDLYELVVSRWEPNEQVDAAECIRTDNGFAQQADEAGTTGGRPPRFAATLGAKTKDGSVSWTCIAAGQNGLGEITSPNASASPDGMTISDVTVSERGKILAKYAGGVLGTDYIATFAFTFDGVARIACQRVKVRQQ